jgi:hypothetical protein
VLLLGDEIVVDNVVGFVGELGFDGKSVEVVATVENDELVVCDGSGVIQTIFDFLL